MALTVAPLLLPDSARDTGQRWALLRPLVEGLSTTYHHCMGTIVLSNQRFIEKWLQPAAFPWKLLDQNPGFRIRLFQFLLIYGLLLCGINAIIKGVADPTGWSQILLDRRDDSRQNKTNSAERRSAAWTIDFPTARPPLILRRPPPGIRPPLDFPPVRPPSSSVCHPLHVQSIGHHLHDTCLTRV